MTWKTKAHEMIAQASTTAYNQANAKKNGKPYKKHRPYTLPIWVSDLIDAIGRDDEECGKAIMLYPHLRDF